MSIVFDVGGTSLRFAVFDRKTQQLAYRTQIATPNYLSSKLRGEMLVREVLSVMRQCVFQDRNFSLSDGVVAALPGPIINGAYVSQLPTILGELLSAPIPIRTLAQEVFGTDDVRLLNDITAAGYRFLERFGPDFCVISVGSGVGCKLFLNGVPIIGRQGDAGEIGHVALCSDEVKAICECGGIDHVGAISSGRGIVHLGIRLARKNANDYRISQSGTFCPDPSDINTSVLVAAFRDGDPWTVQPVRNSLTPLAQAMAAIRASTGISRYVVIGGLAIALGQRYVVELEEACERHYSWLSWTDTVYLGPDDDCNGLIGAGIYSSIEEGKV